MHENLKMLDQVHGFVRDLDPDGDGQIELHELEQAWDSEEMCFVREVVRLPVGSGPEELLWLLDTDGSGLLDPAEFVRNVVRMITNDSRQFATAQQSASHRLLALAKENQRMLREVGEEFRSLERGCNARKGDLGVLASAVSNTSDTNRSTSPEGQDQPGSVGVGRRPPAGGAQGERLLATRGADGALSEFAQKFRADQRASEEERGQQERKVKVELAELRQTLEEMRGNTLKGLEELRKQHRQETREIREQIHLFPNQSVDLQDGLTNERRGLGFHQGFVPLWCRQAE